MDYKTGHRIRAALAVAVLALAGVLLTHVPFMGAAVAEEAPAAVQTAEPLTWEYLTTVGGCTVFVMLFVQLTKKLIDKLVYIPTTLYAYVIAVLTMLAATALTGELTPSSGLLTLFNGWLVAAAAGKSYDVLKG